MANEIYLNPQEFQTQADELKTKSEALEGLAYEIDLDSAKLASLDKLAECVKEMNLLLAEFAEVAKADAATMQNLKTKWMNADKEYGNMTLKDVVFGEKN